MRAVYSNYEMSLRLLWPMTFGSNTAPPNTDVTHGSSSGYHERIPRSVEPYIEDIEQDMTNTQSTADRDSVQNNTCKLDLVSSNALIRDDRIKMLQRSGFTGVIIKKRLN